MTTVREVLERLGPPPPSEVCWDWGFQLLQFHERPSIRMWPPARAGAALPHPKYLNAISPVWSRLSLDDHGLLQAVSSDEAQRLTSAQINELLDQLTYWAGIPHQTDYQSSQQTEPNNSARAPEQPLPSVAHPKPTRFARRPKRSWQPAILRHALRPWVAVSAVMVVGLGYAALRGLFTTPTTASRHNVRSAAELSPAGPPASPIEANPVEANLDSGEPTQAAELSLLATTPTSSAADAITPGTELRLAPAGVSADAVLISPSLQDLTSQETSQAPSTTFSEPPARPSVAVIMDEIGRLANRETSAGTTSVLDMDPSLTAGASPAMVLPLFPPTRLVTLADKLRVREPQWLLRLEAGPDFSVLPSETQVLSARQPLMWTIQPADPQSADPQSADPQSADPQSADRQSANRQSAATIPTRLIVHVESGGSRKAALRWRVAASAPDLPKLLFPMDNRVLDMTRRRLKELLQSLEVQQQVHRQTARSSGLPQEVRSALAQQRQFVQEQMELAERLMQIVSEATQLLAGLDGQLDVHVSLRESGADSSPPLLQLGSP